MATSGIELRGTGGNGARGGGGILERRLGGNRYEDVQALGAAGLDRAAEAGIGQRLANGASGADRHREGIGIGWVKVEHQVGRPVRPVGPHQRRVVLNRALVREPEQRPTVVAQRVVHVTLGRLGPPSDPLHPRRGVRRQVLLHEGLLAPMHPDDGQGTVFQAGEDPVTDRVEVVDQVPLAGIRSVEERLVEVRELDAVACLIPVRGAHGEGESTSRYEGSAGSPSDMAATSLVACSMCSTR